MSLRQIQIKAPTAYQEAFRRFCERLDICEHYTSTSAADGFCLSLLTVEVGVAASVLAALEVEFGPPDRAGYSVTILPVTAAIPDHGASETDVRTDKDRTAREELLEEVSTLTRLDRNFVAFVLLSSVIAAFGLLADDVAVVIGAMVIAPLLGPAISLSLGAVMAEAKLIKEGALAELVGLGLAALVGYTVATLLPGYAPELSQQIQARTEPNLFHLILALGSGFAGALSLTGGASSTLVGVMVSVALMSPAVVSGIGLAVGDVSTVIGAGLLVLANLIGIVLSGIAAFRFKGVHPGNWLKVREAGLRTRTIVVSIVSLLLITGVPLGRVTLTTMREAQLRSRIGNVAGTIVPAYGWRLKGFEVSSSTAPPTVWIEVQAVEVPDKATVANFRRAVANSIARSVNLELTVVPVDIWH